MAWSIWLAGCSELVGDPEGLLGAAPAWESVEETFFTPSLAKVDLLLVMDDTASMAGELVDLAGVLPDWLDGLEELGIGWQLGVVTMEMDNGDAGLLRGSPYVLTPDLPDRAAAFGEMIDVGTEGLGVEAGLAAAVTALALAADGPNAGFRRSDAALHVVFITDADDQSDAWLGADPAGAFVDALASEWERTGLPAQASAVVGPEPNGCSSGLGSAQAGSRYVQVASATGGVVIPICEPDLALLDPVLSELSVPAVAEFPLQAAPVDGSMTVEVGGSVVDGWTVDSTEPVLRFAEAPAPGSRISVRYLAVVP